MAERRFEFSDEKSNKFWTIEVIGVATKVVFGRIGTSGQTVEKKFADAAAAQKSADKLIAEKLGKGYIEVDGTSAPAPVKKPTEKESSPPKTPVMKPAIKKSANKKLAPKSAPAETPQPIGDNKNENAGEMNSPAIMDEFRDELIEYGKRWSKYNADVMVKYILKGDESAYQSIPRMAGNDLFWFDTFLKHLPVNGPWGPEQARMLRVAQKVGMPESIGEWLGHAIWKAGPEEEVTSKVCSAFESLGWDDKQQLTALCTTGSAYENHGVATSFGRHMLALNEKTIHKYGEFLALNSALTGFFARHRPEWIALIDRWMMPDDAYPGPMIAQAKQLLDLDAAKYEKKVAGRFHAKYINGEYAFELARLLHDKFPEKWLERTIDLASSHLKKRWPYVWFNGTGSWLVRNAPREAVALILQVKEDLDFSDYYDDRDLNQGIAEMAEHLKPAELKPILNKMLDWKSIPLRFHIIETLIQNPKILSDDEFELVLARELGGKPHRFLTKIVKLAARWNLKRMTPELWKAMSHKGKTVRDAAARELAVLGNDAFAPAAGLLADKRAEIRASAAYLLGLLATSEAQAAIEARLDVEENDSARDAMFLALDSMLKGKGRSVDMKEVRRRVERAVKRGIKPPAEWARPEVLPALCYQDGKKLDADTVAYLLDRQSRCGAMKPDVEASGLYALIDKSKSADFAQAILTGFLAPRTITEQEFFKIGGSMVQPSSHGKYKVNATNTEKWALALAGILGNDRLIVPLMDLIGEWTSLDNYNGAGRPQMASWGAQTIGLIGSDAAVRALDTLALRYRAKWKPVGQAAAQTLEEIAERRGLTLDELGDAATPRLGFEPDQPRLIGTGKNQFEIRIEPNFKLAIFDPSTNKPVKSLPAAAGSDAKETIKEIQAQLKEAVKGQTMRLENLMVRQHRWPAARWRELFFDNPVMRPFAYRLVWGTYDDKGRLKATFRALEDLSLTDSDDGRVELDHSSTAGIVHPLEIDSDARSAWARHLDSYEIEQPFVQIDRNIIRLPDSWKDRRSLATHDGHEMDGLAFRGKADRRGWGRGLVDEHEIMFYYKSFPSQQCDFILNLEGVFIDPVEQNGTLGAGFFVKSGSVKISNSTYDAIEDEGDERVMPLGSVPPIVFSEIAGDLEKITGEPCKFDEEEGVAR